MKDMNNKAGRIFGFIMLIGACVSWIYGAYEYGLSKGYEKGYDYGAKIGRIDGLTEAAMKFGSHVEDVEDLTKE